MSIVCSTVSIAVAEKDAAEGLRDCHRSTETPFMNWTQYPPFKDWGLDYIHYRSIRVTPRWRVPLEQDCNQLTNQTFQVGRVRSKDEQRKHGEFRSALVFENCAIVSLCRTCKWERRRDWLFVDNLMDGNFYGLSWALELNLTKPEKEPINILKEEETYW